MHKPKYLISAHVRHAARLKAQDRGLSPDEWLYVPYEREGRKAMLYGRKVPHVRYLVGGFTDKETATLLAGH